MSRPPLYPEAAASLGFLALLGAIRGRARGANVLRAAARVTFWRVGDGSHRRHRKFFGTVV